MTRLVWDQQADKHYESGVSHGVLYPEEGPGVVWNGLVSVQEGFVGGEISSYHFDGIKYLDLMGGKDFIATLRAFSAPREFEPCVGEVSPRPGFILTGQQKVRFGLCYRTELGDGSGYKIHLVYNAVASRAKRDYITLAKAAVPSLLEFRIETVPVPDDTFKASAHFMLDSTKVPSVTLAEIESILYGSVAEEPRLILPDEFSTIFA